MNYEGEAWFEDLSLNEMALFQNLSAGQISLETVVSISASLDMGGIALGRQSLFELEQHSAALF